MRMMSAAENMSFQPDWKGSTPAPSAQTPLSRVDLVIVKDSWNKYLPFDQMLTDLFFERLILDCPELIEQFGPAIDRAPVEFLKFFDLSVRALDETTEASLREAYREAPGARKAQASTIEDCCAYFAAYGVTEAHWERAQANFVWAFSKAPYLEDFERADLEQGVAGSALGRFFARHIAAPAIAFLQAEERSLDPEIIAEMQRGAEKMLKQPREAGIFFYQTLFRTFPDVLRHFRTADMDQLSQHLIEAVVFLSRAAGRPKTLRAELRNLASVHQAHQVPAGDYPQLAGPLLQTLAKFGEPLTTRTRRGWEVLFNRVVRIVAEPMVQQERLLAEARDFLQRVADELEWPEGRLEKRWSEIVHEVRATGTYTHSFAELEHGARMAWRNAPKCIGRISWRNLIVRDRRHVTDPDEMFAECRQHLAEATNGGNIEIVMTVFRPRRQQERWGPRIWNSQLIRYAGYALPEGRVLGDRANLELTTAIESLGWEPPATRTAHDLLPLVIDLPGHAPKVYSWTAGDVLEVPVTHPTEPGIAALGLKWCAVPAIANFRMEIGGIDYGCVPFNGWFMGTEIARNLFEERRYDRASDIARALNLDTSSESTLWRDRAFLELNTAIIHSFTQARVTLVDHQTASRQFMIHDLREKRAGRECPAQWSWIAPAAGGSTTPVWHHEMRDFHLSPSYGYAADRWMLLDRSAEISRLEASAPERTTRPLVIFASETGTAEAYAHQAGRRLAGLAPRVLSADEVSIEALLAQGTALVIVATCRDGEVPASGQVLLNRLAEAAGEKPLDGLNFAVLGIGNRIYPNFCAAATKVDAAFEAAGGARLSALELADEIAGQADTVRHWLELFAKRWSVDEQTSRTRRAIVELIPAQERAESQAGATVTFSHEMFGPGAGAGRSARLIGLDLEPGQPGYRAGDHVAVHPENPPELVEAFARHLGLPPDAWIRILGGGSQILDRYRDGFSLRTLLTTEIDFALTETPLELFVAMRAVSKDADDQAQLDRWIATLDLGDDDPARRALRSRLQRTYLTVVELFDAFPRSVPSLDILIEILPRIRPRLYSIASSPLSHPRQVQLMVAVLSLPVGDGRVRTGLCSHYLSHLVPGQRARVQLKPAPRYLPTGFGGPLVLVGAGTGLSPLFGLIADREARGMPVSSEAPARLYFGCRSEEELLERAQLEAWRKSGRLQRVAVALSRQGPSKAYVQDAIDGDGPRIGEILALPDSHFVISGDAKMAQDVVDVLMRILQREAGLGYSEALSQIETMRREGRLIEDVWGVQLNRDVALTEVVRAKYNSGATWFSRLQRALVGSAPTKTSVIDL